MRNSVEKAAAHCTSSARQMAARSRRASAAPASVRAGAGAGRATTVACWAGRRASRAAGCANRPALHAAAKSGNLVDLTRAIEATAIGEVDKKNLGYSAIHLAAKGGHCEALSLLLESKSDLHARAANGTTALHCAAENNRTEMITLLLNRGSDLEAKANSDDSVLHYAALNGRLAATKLLVAKGADVFAKNHLLSSLTSESRNESTSGDASSYGKKSSSGSQGCFRL